MLNIGFITGNHYPRIGGMEIAVHNLASNLHALEGITASVACKTMPEIPKAFQYPYPCYRAKSFSFLTNFLIERNQYKMIRENNVNILHGPMLHGGGFNSVRLANKLNIPAIAHSRGSDVQLVRKISYGEQLNAGSLKKIRYTIKHSHKILAVSHMNKAHIVDLGADPDKISVIPNGILIDAINGIPSNNLRPKYFLSPDDFVIITVGRNRPVKRMELLFEALKKLKSYKNIKCLCVGPKENLGELAAKYDIINKVVLTGKIPGISSLDEFPPYTELINAYRNSDLYISTSYVESFGNAAADALACGIPIIVGQKHGVRDIIKDGETGWVMTSETATSLAELILSLYEKREELRENKEEIKTSVAHLTWHNVANLTVDFYKSVV